MAWWMRHLRWVDDLLPPPFDGGAIRGIAVHDDVDALSNPSGEEARESIRKKNPAWAEDQRLALAPFPRLLMVGLQSLTTL
eukprot:10794920-Karenia_brevis.AAC.1